MVENIIFNKNLIFLGAGKNYRPHPFPNFDFDDTVKVYLREVTKGEFVDHPPPPGTITFTPEVVKCVVRYLDDAY